MHRPGRPALLLAALLIATLLASPAGASHTGDDRAVAATVAQRPGSASDHTWLFGGKNPIRWDRCDRLTYEINPVKAPKGWKSLVKQALKRTTNASKIRFKYLGKTKAKPTLTSTNPVGTDLVIAFLTAKQTDMLAGPTVSGQGGAATDGTRLFDGRVVLNGPVLSKMANGFGQGPRFGIQGTRGQVVMHEIGHALGLGHAKQRTQVMYSFSTRKPAEWGAGDYKGLRILGKTPSCRLQAQHTPDGEVTSAWLS
jgi:hypothetical protein